MRVSLKKKKRVEKSGFLASLWWTVTRIAKKSSQKNQWRRHSAGVEHAEWWMRGTLCSQGGGGGNDGAAGTCVWGSVAGCASLRGSFGKGQREREMLGIFLQSLLLSLPQPERGRGRHQKISFPVGAQWPPWLLIVPFIPSLHPCLFSLLLNGAI